MTQHEITNSLTKARTEGSGEGGILRPPDRRSLPQRQLLQIYHDSLVQQEGRSAAVED